MRRASLVARLLAFLVDLAFLACVSLLLLASGLAGSFMGAGSDRTPSEIVRTLELFACILLFFEAFLFLFYFTYLTADDGRTIGKGLFGLRVVRRKDGGSPGTARALARAAGYVASAVPFFLGFWMALFSGGRAGHDIMAGTMVIKEE